MSRTVFVIDDNAADRRMLCRTITASEPRLVVRSFAGLVVCYGPILSERPNFIVLDDHIEGITASESLFLLARLSHHAKIIVVSGIQVDRRDTRLAQLGAAAYLSKDDIYEDGNVLMQHLTLSGPTPHLPAAVRMADN